MMTVGRRETGPCIVAADPHLVCAQVASPAEGAALASRRLWAGVA